LGFVDHVSKVRFEVGGLNLHGSRVLGENPKKTVKKWKKMGRNDSKRLILAFISGTERAK